MAKNEKRSFFQERSRHLKLEPMLPDCADLFTIVVAFALIGKDSQLSCCYYHKRSKAGHYCGALLFASCTGILLVESGIVENSARGIRNPGLLEYTIPLKESGIPPTIGSQNLSSTDWHPVPGIRNPRLPWIPLRGDGEIGNFEAMWRMQRRFLFYFVSSSCSPLLRQQVHFMEVEE